MSAPFVISHVLLWALVVLESVMLFVLLRELGRVYLRASESFQRDGVAVGTPLPDIQVRTADDVVSLDSLYDAPYTLIVVATTDCTHCTRVVDLSRRWAARVESLSTLVLVTDDDPGEYASLDGIGLAHVERDDMAERLLVRVTPFVFVVDAHAVVLGKGLVNNNNQLAELLKRARAEVERREPSASRDRAPALAGASS
ncbi:MAG: hypothetical protein M3321_05825 [Actinomycetota bacterium]|nr:hypothetical protein [Actinomycetota bacterium]